MAGTATWTKSAFSDAGQVAELVNPKAPPPPAADGKPLHEWFAALEQAGDWMTAVQFIAHALPRYECVVWAAQTLLETRSADRHDPLMVSVLRWIDNPDDVLRRKAAELAEETREDTPAKLLAEAVMLSGGSLAPEDLPPVQPAPDLCAKLAGGAILTGAYAQPDPQAALAKAMELGEAMVTGG